MTLPTQSTIVFAIGIICLVAGVGGVYLGFPTHTTSIIEQEPSEEAMADAVDTVSVSEIDPIEFSALSPAEQTAFTRARQSSQRTYTDYGASDNGSHFEYRNDIANQYFVSNNGSIYLVRVVVSIHPIVVGGGILSVLTGLALVGGGVWLKRHSV
ncbi:hypothetical protein [Halorubrum aethiopicum]|uniref:hypothetical protein n=1 Tax=Halorubrum aethiopicum TaxID=1758255 RepID=UPI0009B5A3ED|nr:hypothetical protein [Halorubrum aethiopicum]